MADDLPVISNLSVQSEKLQVNLQTLPSQSQDIVQLNGQGDPQFLNSLPSLLWSFQQPTTVQPRSELPHLQIPPHNYAQPPFHPQILNEQIPLNQQHLDLIAQPQPQVQRTKKPPIGPGTHVMYKNLNESRCAVIIEAVDFGYWKIKHDDGTVAIVKKGQLQHIKNNVPDLDRLNGSLLNAETFPQISNSGSQQQKLNFTPNNLTTVMTLLTESSISKSVENTATENNDTLARESEGHFVELPVVLNDDDDDDSVPDESQSENNHDKEEMEDTIKKIFDAEFAYQVLLDNDDDESERHATKLRNSLQEKAELISDHHTIIKKSSKDSTVVEWKVIANDDFYQNNWTEYKNIGFRGINFDHFDSMTHPIQYIFEMLFPCENVDAAIQQLNDHITKLNIRGSRKINLVSRKEWDNFHAILIGAGSAGYGGKRLWEKDENSFVPSPDVGKYMKYFRFNEIKLNIMHAFFDLEGEREGDKWYPIRRVVKSFNNKRRQHIAASKGKTHDESMSAFRPQTTKYGKHGFPILTFVIRKPEDLGTELKSSACTVTGVMLALEIQEGKEAMRLKKYFEPGAATTATTMRLIDMSEHCGQPGPVESNLNFADSWFAGVKTADACKSKGHEFIGIVKTNRALYPLKELEKLMKNWPGGTSLVLETKCSPKGNRFLAIGYKYNATKILGFVATDKAGSTALGAAYHARYTDEFENVMLRNVNRPALISAYFLASNRVDNHNQSRQGDLKLEKHWVTQDGWFRLYTTLIGMTVTDSWKCMIHGLPSKHTLKNLSINKFSGILAKQLLMSEASSDPVPGSKIMPLTMEMISPLSHDASENSNDQKRFWRESFSPPPSASNYSQSSSSVLVFVPPDAPIVPEIFREKHRSAKAHYNQRKICKESLCQSLHKAEKKLQKTSMYCITCNKFFCSDSQETGRFCFYSHICEAFLNSEFCTDKRRFKAEYINWKKLRETLISQTIKENKL